MKILIIQENGHHEANRNFRECFCLKRGFEHHGATVEIWGKGHNDFDPNPDQRMYDQYFSHFDLVFAIENWDWMPDINRIRTKKFIWAIDAHCKGTQVYEQYGFDKVLHSTKQFAKDGCWLANCYDDDLIKPLNIQKEYDIGFCGNINNRGQLINLLCQYYNFKKDIFVIGKNMVKAINSYKIHFNMNISNDINYRNFETMGCQTALLTSYHPLYKKLGMVHGENCMIYSSVKELIDMTEELLKNKEMRENISKAGYELVKNRHTYKHRAQTILETI